MRLGLASAILLLGALASACGDDDPPGDEVGDTTSTGTTGATAGSSSSSSSSSSGTGADEGGTADTGVASSSGGSDSGTSTSGSTGGSSGSESSTGEGVAACEVGCVTEYACGTDWASEEECVIACEANLVKAAAFSRPCRAAWEDLASCLGTLSCDDFAEWQSPAALPYPCSDSDILLEIECKGQ